MVQVHKQGIQRIVWKGKEFNAFSTFNEFIQYNIKCINVYYHMDQPHTNIQGAYNVHKDWMVVQ